MGNSSGSDYSLNNHGFNMDVSSHKRVEVSDEWFIAMDCAKILEGEIKVGEIAKWTS